MDLENIKYLVKLTKSPEIRRNNSIPIFSIAAIGINIGIVNTYDYGCYLFNLANSIKNTF